MNMDSKSYKIRLIHFTAKSKVEMLLLGTNIQKKLLKKSIYSYNIGYRDLIRQIPVKGNLVANDIL